MNFLITNNTGYSKPNIGKGEINFQGGNPESFSSNSGHYLPGITGKNKIIDFLDNIGYDGKKLLLFHIIINMKLFNKKKNDYMFDKITCILKDDYMLINSNYSNKYNLFKMIKYVYIFHINLKKNRYINKLKNNGKIEKFKILYPDNYEKSINSLILLDNEFYIPIYGYKYSELLLNGKIEKYTDEVYKFFNEEINGEIFNEFVNFIGKDYEFFIYLMFDELLNRKIIYNNENKIEDSFLNNKMKEYSEDFGNHNMIVK